MSKKRSNTEEDEYQENQDEDEAAAIDEDFEDDIEDYDEAAEPAEDAEPDDDDDDDQGLIDEFDVPEKTPARESSQEESLPVSAPSKSLSRSNDDDKEYAPADSNLEVDDADDMLLPEEARFLSGAHKLTQRQRRMLGETETESAAASAPLPDPPKFARVLTPEQQLKREATLKLRRAQARAAEERTKAEIVDRLLNPNAPSRSRAGRPRGRVKASTIRSNKAAAAAAAKASMHLTHWREQRRDGSGEIHLPPGMVPPEPLLSRQPPRKPPPPVRCAAPACLQKRRYSCRSNNLPVCSLQCYRLVSSKPPAKS